MKVYHWQGFRHTLGHRVQTREIVCTSSKRAARELVHRRIPINEISESFGPDEIDAASARPETVLWRPLDQRKPYQWTEVPKEQP